MKSKILVIDDEEAIRKSLRMVLEYEGYECVEAGAGPEGLEAMRRESPDAILLDIKMPGMDGLEVLQAARARDAHTPILMISGHGDIPTAVEAIHQGAYDFLEKPLESERVLTALRNAIERKRLRDENLRLRHQVEGRLQLIGGAGALKSVRESIARAAPSHATVLITGESGTGKELIAWEIHRRSPRAEKAFVKVNCAAIPEELIESELFGHEKGAFTGATARQTGKFVQADGGTIFLDEIGDMSPRTQAKVLRVLEGGEVEPVGMAKTLRIDVRVIAATNKDLRAQIRAGAFREDLYFRLNVVPIVCPPLRERREDIPLLADHFLATLSGENNLKPKRFSPEALQRLAERPWRGNVRELRNAIERLLIMAEHETIEAADVDAFEPETVSPAGAAGEGTPQAPRSTGAAPEGPDPGRFRTLQEYRDEAEKIFILRKLREFRWNVSRTARAIETPRSNLYKRLEHYGISRDQVQE
ncbi:MAG TPA: sigma-54 dependent transcriptional regulator [Candidatus Polarisedimenticolia bacterium]|nr:sigma-54 dependent transcriptional regulator [Candidatus Polarisedimenticolia bacterium]